MNCEQQMRNALLNYGAINENWRVKLTHKEILPFTDYAKVIVEVYKPRCRKPYGICHMYVDTVRGITNFERNTFIRL